MTVAAALIDDLAAEHDALDALVGPLPADRWATPTLAEGWDIADSVSHLCYFDETATLALTEPDAFRAHAEGMLTGTTRPDDDVQLGRAVEPAALLARWRTSRAELLSALGDADPTERVPWYGPAMSLASFTTARLMETWAHGLDVAEALGAPPVVSDRLRHVIRIGVGAKPYAYLVNAMADPGTPIRVEATPPAGGDPWTWGPDDAPDRVTGLALDLALVLTRRRHPADTAVEVTGPAATEWISIAQTFAGPPGPARPAR